MAENGSLAAVKLAVNKLGGPMEKPWAEKTDEEEVTWGVDRGSHKFLSYLSQALN